MKNIELIKGDCLEKMKGIESGSVDLILTDPPYGTTACKWDSVIPFEPMWEQLNRVIKPNGAIVLFGSEPFSSALRMSNIKNYKYDWVWHKNSTSGFALAKKAPLKNHELISVFYKKQCNYYPIKELRDMSDSSRNRMKYDFTSLKGNNEINNGLKKVQYVPEDKELSYPKSVKKFNNVPNNSPERLHPTQKPVPLLEYLIKTYTLENEMVLDFTMGSGSTGVACLNTNRNFIGIELDDNYFNIASTRINNHSEQV